MGDSSCFCCVWTSQPLEWLEQGWCLLGFPVVSWEAGSCWGRVVVFSRWSCMVRLGQGCTPVWGKLASLGYSGSREQCLLHWKQQQKGPSSETLWLNIPLLYSNSIPCIPWFIRVHGSCQANRQSLSYSVIDFWESQIKGLYLLS
jgi:hypothetical protein